MTSHGDTPPRTPDAWANIYPEDYLPSIHHRTEEEARRHASPDRATAIAVPLYFLKPGEQIIDTEALAQALMDEIFSEDGATADDVDRVYDAVRAALKAQQSA